MFYTAVPFVISSGFVAKNLSLPALFVDQVVLEINISYDDEFVDQVVCE